jgi:hypothetical protein
MKVLRAQVTQQWNRLQEDGGAGRAIARRVHERERGEAYDGLLLPRAGEEEAAIDGVWGMGGDRCFVMMRMPPNSATL